jgi:transcriptional regulator with XRE-family HTH domain
MSQQVRKRKAGVVGEFVQKRREELGLTRAELARRVGCSANMVCLVENGIAQFPFRRWQLYSTALEVPEHQVLRLALEERYPEVLPYFEGREYHLKSQ